MSITKEELINILNLPNNINILSSNEDDVLGIGINDIILKYRFVEERLEINFVEEKESYILPNVTNLDEELKVDIELFRKIVLEMNKSTESYLIKGYKKIEDLEVEKEYYC